jgi:molybdopterin synthase catalytic subunit
MNHDLNTSVSVRRIDEDNQTMYLQAVSGLSSDSRCGAVATFHGITRDDIVDNKTVIGLQFEAHPPLAERVIRDMVAELRNQIPELLSVYIHHQLGYVPVNQTNVFVAVSASHRKEAFRGVEAVMNGLKASAPIWKKECFSDNSHVWKENSEFHTSSINS